MDKNKKEVLRGPVGKSEVRYFKCVYCGRTLMIGDAPFREALKIVIGQERPKKEKPNKVKK